MSDTGGNLQLSASRDVTTPRGLLEVGSMIFALLGLASSL